MQFVRILCCVFLVLPVATPIAFSPILEETQPLEENPLTELELETAYVSLGSSLGRSIRRFVPSRKYLDRHHSGCAPSGNASPFLTSNLFFPNPSPFGQLACRNGSGGFLRC